MTLPTATQDTTLVRPRAFRREGVARRILPFAATGIVIILLTPFVLDGIDVDLILLALAIDVAIVLSVLALPWERLPRWCEAVPPILGFLIVAVLREATGGGPSILAALGMLIVFWFALHGTRGDLFASLVAMFVTLAGPVFLIGAPAYPAEELVRAVLWTILSGVIGLTTQRAVETNWRNARDAERIAELRASVNEDLRAADQLKGQFVAMVSHELRTPLTSIRGFANTIQHHYAELSDEERQRFARIIEEQAERLSRLVEDLLTLSRIESGSVSRRRRVLDVWDAIEHAVSRFSDLDIDVHCAPGLRVMADPDHVEQMLVNYLANACQYGAPPVRVSAARVGDNVQIVVADAGPGVDPEFVPHLFERFARSPKVSVAGGTGLGLSIVLGLAQAEGGEAWYEPSSDGGACFAISLPTFVPLAHDGEPRPQVAILDT